MVKRVRVPPSATNLDLKISQEGSKGISYASSAPEYVSLGWKPIPVSGKSPVPSGATGRAGTVTDEKIAAWSTDQHWANANIAIRHEESIGIDVDAYGAKRGDQTLAAHEARLGELPVTITSTSRGADSPSRQHFFRVPAGMEFMSELPGGDVEIIQRAHRYTVVHPSIHPDTGQQYRWYGYEGELLEDLPAIDDLEELPAAWLEYLTKPVVEQTLAPFGGSVDEWLAKCNQDAPSDFILEWVDQIPQDDFGHDVMVQLQAALVGMGASGKPGIPFALDALRRAWLREPYDTPEYRADWILGLRGAVEKFGNFEEDVLEAYSRPIEKPARPEIDYVAVAARVQADEFFDAWTGLPQAVTPESLTGRVQHLLDMMQAEGVSREESVAVAFRAAARNHADCPLRTQDDVDALWRETKQDAQAEEPAPEPSASRVHLLKPAEELALQSITWWGDDKDERHFMARMEAINPIMSEQFYRLNRWIILSLIFAHRAVIPRKNGGDLLLNFYSIRLGPSGIGKSESLSPVKDILKAYYLPEDSPDIGGNATEAGLMRALHGRDGKTSFFHSDEADGILLAWSDKLSAFAGMKQFVTNVYGGEVGPAQRSTAPELNKHSRAYMCADLTGIDERISDAIEPHDWESGFINRFIWAKGHRKTKTREQKRFPIRRSAKAGGSPSAEWYAQWAAEFRRIESTTLASPNGEPAWMDIADDVLERHVDTHDRLERVAQNSVYPERLRPTFTRMEDIILKCAALVAITKRRRRVEMEDYLIALEQAEEWLENVMEMVERTDESPRARQVNRLAALIASRDGLMKRSEIHAMKGYAGAALDTNRLIDELVQQGRAEIMPIGTGKTDALIHLTGEGKK